MLDLYRKYHSSDLFSDVRSQYTDALRAGLESPKATEQLLADYEPALSDEEDAPIFWFALANTQWEMGRLEERVQHHALVCIDKALRDDAVCAETLLQELTEFKQKLLSPQPPKKQIRPHRLYHTDWNVGDVFAYCLDGEKVSYPGYHNMYVYFVVNGTQTWYPGHTIPVVYVYWVMSKEQLTLDQIKGQAYLPQFYRPVAYKNNPRMRRKYSLALLCTSARVIPQKRLTFLGKLEDVRRIEHEDPSAYAVAWKKFDQYMIENYIAWDES